MSTGFRPETGMVVRYKMCVLYAFIAGLWISSVPFVFARPLAETKPTTERVRPCKILYAGFVGAMETSNRQGSGVVQLRDTLSGPGYADVCAESFRAFSWESCRDWILSRLPGNSGSVAEGGSKDTPRIILVGHSAGGWAMLKVARDLRDKGIPIELVVLLDGVGITDPVPRNVKAIAVFHARGILMFLTTKNIRIENPQNTTVIANLVVKGASHLSITRDPQVRDVVLSTVDALLEEMHSYPTPSR